MIQMKISTKRLVSRILLISALFLYVITPIMAEASQLDSNKDKKILQSKHQNNNKVKGNKKKLKKQPVNRFIVKYKENKGEQGKENIKKVIKDDVKYIKKLKRKTQRFDLITMNTEMNYEDLLEKLQLGSYDTDIEYIQPDYEISLNTNDTYYPEQWSLGEASNEANDGTNSIANANIISAWKGSTGKDTLVAVIDTGIDIDHEDLSQNIWTNRNEIPDNGIDDDGNGYIDDINGWNFNDNTNILYNEGSVEENHGTHIAGIIAAAKDNNKGITGTAPEAKIMLLKVFNNGVAYTSDIIEAIDYAQNMGAEIVNCSWGRL